MKTIGYAAQAQGAALEPFSFDRRELRENDVAIEILYTGVCHTDLHGVRNDWGNSVYPLVPGHEIVGRVIATGRDARKHRIGDHVAVGCIVDSCQHCDQCRAGEEQFCRHEATQTYNDRDRITGDPTFGGYSRHIVVREEFVLTIPDGLDISRAAPLLCAGITTWSPLRTWGVGPGIRVAVVGLGGLGHMAVKLAAGLGADVTVISRTETKAADALALGAQAFLASGDPDARAAAAESFDLIIDTIPVRHDVSSYMPLLDIDGTLVIVGHLGMIDEQHTFSLVKGRRRLSASPIGGIAETQEMLDFCARLKILPDCEMIGITQLGEAFDRMERSDVRYRFVVDMASLPLPG